MPDFWDERFDTEDYVFGEAPNAFLAAQHALLSGRRRALAVADGEGRNGVWLAEQGLEVTAIDASSVGLAKAQKLAARRKVQLTTELVDVADYGWPEGAFDVIAAIFIQFADPPLRQAIFAGMCRALAPGGVLILEGYGPAQLAYGTGGPRQAEKLYTVELLQAAFGDLQILQLVARDALVSEGSGHAGMSALVDLVARKPG